MHPEIAGVGVYFPINGIAILVNAVLLFVLLRRESLPVRGVLFYLVALALAGVFGAKLYDVLMRGWIGTPLLELQGGYRYPGALLGLICAAVWLRGLLPRSLTVARFLDCWTPGFALALAIGRLACFLHGCCHGALSSLPWAVQYPSGSFAWNLAFGQGLIGANDSLSPAVHPLPLYSMGIELVTFAICVWLVPRRRFDGQIILVFLAIHGTAKALVEFTRWEYSPAHQTVLLMSLLSICVLIQRVARKEGALLWSKASL